MSDDFKSLLSEIIRDLHSEARRSEQAARSAQAGIQILVTILARKGVISAGDAETIKTAMTTIDPDMPRRDDES